MIFGSIFPFFYPSFISHIAMSWVLKFFGLHIILNTKLEVFPWPMVCRVLCEDNTRQDMGNGLWNTQTPSLYIPRNNSLLDKITTLEPVIEPRTSWSVRNDVNDGESAGLFVEVYLTVFDLIDTNFYIVNNEWQISIRLNT